MPSIAIALMEHYALPEFTVFNNVVPLPISNLALIVMRNVISLLNSRSVTSLASLTCTCSHCTLPLFHRLGNSLIKKVVKRGHILTNWCAQNIVQNNNTLITVDLCNFVLAQLLL